MPNLLANESSPYLLQHANNPINWYPWGEEALTRAIREDKPIFLSIGYSTCHWCHRMAKEAFSNEEIAKYLNDNFIAIKVDREERPDIDAVYMDAAVRMTENAGWPLNIFLTSDKKPFFAGTYYPDKAIKGSLDFLTILKAINKNLACFDLYSYFEKLVLNYEFKFSYLQFYIAVKIFEELKLIEKLDNNLIKFKHNKIKVDLEDSVIFKKINL